MKNTGCQTVINNVIPSIVVIWLMQMLSAGCEGLESTDNGLDNVAPLGNQAVKGENKSQPVASGETGLLNPRKTGNS